MLAYKPFVAWALANGNPQTLVATHAPSLFVIVDGAAEYAAGLINCQGHRFLCLEVIQSADATAYLRCIVQVSLDGTVWNTITKADGTFDEWSVPKLAERPKAEGGAYRAFELGAARYARVQLALTGAAAETGIVRGMLA